MSVCVSMVGMIVELVFLLLFCVSFVCVFGANFPVVFVRRLGESGLLGGKCPTDLLWCLSPVRESMVVLRNEGILGLDIAHSPTYVCSLIFVPNN